MKSRSAVSVTSSYSSKALSVVFSAGGGSHVRVLLLENLCNWFPGLSALVIWEEIPSPLLVVLLVDGLPELT